MLTHTRFFSPTTEGDSRYMLLIMYSGGEVRPATTKDKETGVLTLVTADFENMHLLTWMGNKLVGEDLIVGFQIVKTIGYPTYSPQHVAW